MEMFLVWTFHLVVLTRCEERLASQKSHQMPVACLAWNLMEWSFQHRRVQNVDRHIFNALYLFAIGV
jgi:hypothetical protein